MHPTPQVTFQLLLYQHLGADELPGKGTAVGSHVPEHLSDHGEGQMEISKWPAPVLSAARPTGLLRRALTGKAASDPAARI